MFKIGKKNVSKTFQRSTEVVEVCCLALNADGNFAVETSPVQWTQTCEDRLLQNEFERKRAQGIMHSRNTFG